MSGTLQDRVAAWVADHPGETAFTIARAVRGRDQTVTEILNGPLFVAESLRRWASDRARGYRLAVPSSGQGGEGRKRRAGTHKERVLRLLEDGRPHSYMEGYRLGVMLHSRVADLRRDGYDIRCWRDGDDYLYRLVGSGSCVSEGDRQGTSEGEADHGLSLTQDPGPTSSTTRTPKCPPTGPGSTCSAGGEVPVPPAARTDGAHSAAAVLPPADSQLSLLGGPGAYGRAA